MILADGLTRFNREFTIQSTRDFTFNDIKIGQLFCIASEFIKYGQGVGVLIKLDKASALYLGALGKQPIKADEVVYIVKINHME